MREAGSSTVKMLSYLLVPLLLIVGLGYLQQTSGFEKNSEIQVGFLIVIAIIALITLLFIVAAGFSQLQLTDPKQALGLPEGSIRAMIALMLIMVFIIFGIFVFRLTATGREAGPVTMTLEQLIQLKNVSFVERIPDKEGEYNVWLRSDLTEEGARLATQ